METLNRKKDNRRLVPFLLTICLLLGLVIPIFAAPAVVEKEEVVYINLNHDGSVDEIYVVNSFELNEDGQIIDYGDYTSFREMTSSGKFQIEKEKIVIDAKAGKLFYEGTLNSKAIPWSFDIQYFMDNKKYTAEQIAGKSGALEIEIKVRSSNKGSNPFFDNYTLQASLNLDTTLCKNIKAENATMANAGKNKMLSFMVLPGKEDDISVTADVVDFEMDGLSINGITMDMSLDFDSDSMFGSQLQDLKDGVAELDDGAQELMDGTKELAENTGKFKDAIEELDEGVVDLKDGTKKFKDGVNDLLDGVKDLDEGLRVGTTTTPSMIDGVTGLSGGLEELAGGNAELIGGSMQIFEMMINAANEQLSPSGIVLTVASYSAILDTAFNNTLDYLLTTTEGAVASGSAMHIKGIKSYLDANSSSTTFAAIIEDANAQLSAAGITLPDPLTSRNYVNTLYGVIGTIYKNFTSDSTLIDLVTLKGQLEGYEQFHNGLVAYTGGVDQLSAGAKKLLTGTIELKDGVVELRKGVVKLKSGSVDLNNGVIDLSDGVIKLLDGAVELHDGTVELHDGVVTLAEGTLEFRDKTANIEKDMKTIIKDKIKEMMGGNFTPISFVSKKNTNVNLVQFVMQTQSIKKPEPGEDVSGDEPAQNIWQRFIKLWGDLISSTIAKFK